MTIRDEKLLGIGETVVQFYGSKHVGDNHEGPLNNQGNPLKLVRNAKCELIHEPKNAHTKAIVTLVAPAAQLNATSGEVRLARGLNAPSGEVRLARGPHAHVTTTPARMSKHLML
jgi:hypothetical protein